MDDPQFMIWLGYRLPYYTLTGWNEASRRTQKEYIERFRWERVWMF